MTPHPFTLAPIRYCVNCKWMKPITFWGWLSGDEIEHAKCLNPATQNSKDKAARAAISPEANSEPAFCEVARGDYGGITAPKADCGKRSKSLKPPRAFRGRERGNENGMDKD
jgi:hypothetical protein